MRAALLLGLTMIAGIPNDLSGQTRTEDGVAALARGDYQRAVEILEPLAEDWRSRDTAAQFFMASLYDTGRGVPLDPLRACALYIRASSEYNDPFGRQATALAAASIGRSGPEFNEQCQLLASVGFDNGFEPVTFDLGPGHFVEWTLAAATVTFDGRTRREPMPFIMPGARFLPLRYTELATGPTRSLRRHFIEVFVWQPSTATRTTWELHWHVMEVVGDRIKGIDTSGPLTKMDADAPPSRDSFNVRNYAEVRVDEDGNAEWLVRKGPLSLTQRIETEDERHEAREAERAHESALKKVDWSRRHDVNRQPTMSYADAGGCGHIYVYGWTADRAEVGTVRIDAPALGLASQPMTFDLARNSANISVETYVYDAPRRRFDFCTDVVFTETGASERTRWRAIAGTVTVELSAPGSRAAPRVTVTLSNVVLQNAAGMTVKIAGPVRLTASVGSVFG